MNILEPECVDCGKPITSDGGWFVTRTAWHAYRDSKKAWTKAHPKNEGISMDELAYYPEVVRWVPVHWGCPSYVESDQLYGLDVKDVDSATKVLRWTAHFMEKNWLKDTNWNDMLVSWADGFKD